ncbi:MAG: hypothetical protein COA84_08760 [Robiginitomaculum sp.]|nr:MAG: hypothetical protein COA84_08760 [Robiginitomaculum sp.]
MLDTELEAEILALLNNQNSVLGVDLATALGNRYFEIWRTCHNSSKIYSTPFGHYYLRIDKKIEGMARLSPSILRDFLTYTRISTLEKFEQALDDATQSRQEHVRISDEKRSIARQIIAETLSDDILAHTGVLIAGDVCRNMAHLVPRPERTTGKLVRGSDIDLIFVIEKEGPLRVEIEERITEAKAIYLQHPALREELDFVVNTLDHYREAATFKEVHDMISCKAALEGQHLAGSKAILKKSTDILLRAQIPRKVIKLTEKAFSDRLQAMERLRKDPNVIGMPRERRLFYYSDEIWEFMLS